MKIKLKEMSIRDLVENYIDNKEEGIVGYNNRLNIRPKYQREYVYKDKQRDAVIRSIWQGFPINTMYWVKNNESEFELLDGQQRTISICKFINGEFALDLPNLENVYFHNLTEQEQNRLLDYKLMVYVCEGDERDKLEWFRTINIAGEKLTNQELLNINYTGEWLTSAKGYFAKTNCVASQISEKYTNANPIRQELLELALDWISDGDIIGYMSRNHKEKNASELFQYFKEVISWVDRTFTDYYKEMKGLNFGKLYNKYGKESYNSENLAEEIKELMRDYDIDKKKGIFEYVLIKDKTEDDKILVSGRVFKSTDIRVKFESQDCKCNYCGTALDFSNIEADHIKPYSKGGKSNFANLQILCTSCNREKSNKK